MVCTAAPQKYFPRKMGRPPLWNSTVVESYSKFVKDGEYQRSLSDFLKEAQKCQQEASRKRKGDDPDTLTKGTMKRVDLKLGIEEGTTLARADACSSVRNVVYFGAEKQLYVYYCSASASV